MKLLPTSKKSSNKATSASLLSSDAFSDTPIYRDLILGGHSVPFDTTLGALK